MHAADALLAAQNLGRQNPSLAVTLFRRFRPRGDEGDDTSGKSLVGVLSWYFPDACVLWGRQCGPCGAGENGMRAQAFAGTSGRARSSLTPRALPVRAEGTGGVHRDALRLDVHRSLVASVSGNLGSKRPRIGRRHGFSPCAPRVGDVIVPAAERQRSHCSPCDLRVSGFEFRVSGA
jgi:hypothetical protein